MTVFDLGVTEKEIAGATAIDEVNRALLLAVAKRMKSHRITKSKIAERLEVDRSAISRLLRGNQNITARSLGEILWALEFDFSIQLEDLLEAPGNHAPVHTVVAKSVPVKENFLSAGGSDDRPKGGGGTTTFESFVRNDQVATSAHGVE